MGEGTGALYGAKALSAVLLLLPAAVRGQESDGVAAVEEAPNDAPTLAIGGRVFARAAADERQAFVSELSVPSARLGVKAGFRYAETEVSADLASSAMLKDAYVRLHDGEKRVRLYAGRFKAPFLARAVISAWELPLISRGLVEEYLVDGAGLGGRRLGAMAEVKLPLLKGWRASAGIFQGSRDPTGVPMGQDASGRIQARVLRDLAVGLSGYHAGTFGGPPGSWARALAADSTFLLRPARLEAEVSAGRLAVGDFRGVSGLALFDLPLDPAGSWRLEPLLGGELLALVGGASGRGVSATLGVNVAYAERLRLQAQVERAVLPGDGRPANRGFVQLGARF